MARAHPVIAGLAVALLIVTLSPIDALGTCPSCADSVASTNPSACGRWEPIEACTYPVPSPESGACPGGKWPYGLHAVHMALMHTGKVLVYGHTTGATGYPLYSSVAHYWDYRAPAEGGQSSRTLIATPQTTVPATQWIDLECGAMVMKSNGKLLSVGGVDAYEIADTSYVYKGNQAAYLFDAEKFEASSGDSGWVRTDDMALRRYYPTATMLPDGRVLVTSGQIIDGDFSSIASPPEIYDDQVGTPWSSLTSAPTPAGSMRIYYPFIHVMPGPSTRILHSGRTLQSGDKMQTLDLDVASPNWQATSVTATIRGGTPLVYEPGRVFKSGGPTANGQQAINQTEIVVAGSPGITSATATASMGVVRMEQNLVALPDGKVLIVGGGIRPVEGDLLLTDATYRTEIFAPPADPTTSAGEMCKVAWMRHRDPDGGGSLTGIPRMYHSTALLLPDGRVLAAGGEVKPDATSPTGCPQPTGIGIPPTQPVDHCISADFYKPPYLFRADNSEITSSDRPQVQSMPATVGTGSVFPVTLSSVGSGATAITGVRCIRPSATTHAYDFEQRSLALPFVHQGGGSYTLTAPVTLNDAPPGYYMIFLMNNASTAGHPSMGKFAQIWGIPENSLDIAVAIWCGNPGTVRFDVGWNTTLETDGTNTDLLVLYPPGTSCGAGGIITFATPNGTSHFVTKQLNCQSGTWHVQAFSSRSDGSYSRSVCRAVNVVCVSCPGCNPPPCQFD